MQRFHQILFVFSLLALCWLWMMAVHELGHVLGAYVTGGQVEIVVLYPLAISRTDVSPNPHPAIVVWLGPIIGCLLPLAVMLSVPKQLQVLRKIAEFFAGFCLIANGTYISFGTFNSIGDCGEMLRTGTPSWVMLVFGVVAISTGLTLWHRLGSFKDFQDNAHLVSPNYAYIAFCTAVSMSLLELAFSSN